MTLPQMLVDPLHEFHAGKIYSVLLIVNTVDLFGYLNPENPLDERCIPPDTNFAPADILPN